MTWNELKKLLKYLNDKEKQHLEELRIIKHAILLPHSTNGLDLTDVMKFSWDDEEDEEFKLII